jgi:alpha-beta hydrolase superfamily lysophospholipase
MTELIGTDVLCRKWDVAPPAASPKAVFLLVHGLGAHSADLGRQKVFRDIVEWADKRV